MVLLSSLMDFRTLRPSGGNDLAYVAYLPAYAAVAHYHGKLKGDRDAMVKKATDYANGAYASALLKGYTLKEDERKKVATELSVLTALPVDLILRHDLRIDPSYFRKELLRSDGIVLGRFDARTAWAEANRAGSYPRYDPSFAVAKGAFSLSLIHI